jgi:hypothetical protein
MDDIDESIGFAAELDEVLAVPTFDSIYDAVSLIFSCFSLNLNVPLG